MNRHVLFVAPSAYPLGGVAVWLEYLANGLAKTGWRVTVGLTAGRRHDVACYRAFYPDLQGVVEIINPTGSREGRVRALLAALRKISPDLAVAVNIPDVYEAARRLRCAGEVKRLRVAMAIHGFQPDILNDAKRWRGILDGVIGTNQLTCALLRDDTGVDEGRVYYAPYGVAREERRQSRNGEQIKGRKHRLEIAWVGRIEQYQKRALDLPEILSKLEQHGVDYRLTIAGGGPLEKDLRRGLEKKTLTGKVEFPGVLKPDRMDEVIYRKADVLLVTSFWETGPIVIWEAMARGVAVVSSRYVGSGLERGLKDGENCLLFDIDDTKEAAVRLSAARDDTLRSKLVTGGLDLIEDRYNRKASIAAWDHSFEAILAKPPLGPGSPSTKIPPSGRLDRLLGVEVAETARRFFGIRFKHHNAGGEWPHSYGARAIEDNAFWEMAAKIDSRKEDNRHALCDYSVNVTDH